MKTPVKTNYDGVVRATQKKVIETKSVWITFNPILSASLKKTSWI